MQKNDESKTLQSGRFTKQCGYKSFCPNPINQQWHIESPDISTLLEEANLRLGERNAFSAFVPDVDVFIRMHIVKEATQSSRIEGARTRMDEALLAARDINLEDKDDWQEVQNYIEAMNYAIRRLEAPPFLPGS